MSDTDTSTRKLCCEEDCENLAEFQIWDTRPDTVGTLSCEKHVGAMLGHVVDVNPGGHEFWLVMPIGALEAAVGTFWPGIVKPQDPKCGNVR